MAAAAKAQADAPKSAEQELEERRQRFTAALRVERAQKARDDLITYTEFTMPDPADPDNPEASRYVAKKHHRATAAAFEEVIAGRMLRLICVEPPRHGKSELFSRRGPAWALGKNPHWEIVQATYNEEFATDFGRDVRGILQMPQHRQVFPGSALRKGEQASDRFRTTAGGAAYYVGRGGSLTGRGGDLLIADDLFKDRKEADSKTIRDDVWKWFWDVFMSRMKDDCARVVLIMTRWHEDDVIGRLTDPKNPCYNQQEAEHWHILDLPAVARAEDPLGRAPGEALWPERFGLEYLGQIKRINPRGFSALYQGRPSPEEGDYFKRKHLVEYGPDDLPKRLRYYAASDHAVSSKQDGDLNCLMPVGVDDRDDIWVLPDVWWQQSPTDQTVEAMIDLMERYPFLTWWAEDEHISKSIGPFLRKRMEERKVYTMIDPAKPSKDKETRAQAIRGRMAMGKVHFPRYAPWWPDAKEQLLKFPNARHDDFVDPLAHIGQGLGTIVRGASAPVVLPNEPASGTFGWIKWAAKMERKRARKMLRGGY